MQQPTLKQKISMKIDLFNPNKSFFSLIIVQSTIAIITLISIAISLTIYYNSNLELSLSYQGFNHAISVFKVPLGILALLIPLGAIYATNHRSRQTIKQIELTRIQNNFNNYYKHIEEYIKYCEKNNLKLLNELTLTKDTHINYRSIHNKIFPQIMSGESYSHSEEMIIRLKNNATHVVKAIYEENQKNNYQHKNIINLCKGFIISSNIDTVGFQSSYIKKVNNTENRIKDQVELYDVLCLESLNMLYKLAKIFDQCASFDANYRQPKWMAALFGDSGKPIQSYSPYEIKINKDKSKRAEGELREFSNNICEKFLNAI
ncbi:hypothetical protein ACIMS2_004500 [Vibrio harveyi]